MTDYSSKRIAIRFCTPEVINLIESLPRGYKSMIVESALKTYLESEIGQKLTEQLNRRKMSQTIVSKPSANRRGAMKNQLNGDF